MNEYLDYALEVYKLGAKHGPPKPWEACMQEAFYVMTGELHIAACLPAGLRARRKALKLSQAELAERTGVSRNYISILERDLEARKNISLKLAVAIANALQANPEQLFLTEGGMQ